MIKLLAAPVRSIVRFPLFQLAVVVAVILFLQAGDDNSARGQMFNGLDKLVESTVGLLSAVFNVKSFTKSWLTTGFWIAYVYLACLLILSLLRVVISKVVDFVGWSNLFGLRNAIARERGIAAYRAWVPFERIRPAGVLARGLQLRRDTRHLYMSGGQDAHHDWLYPHRSRAPVSRLRA